jgi:flagellar operon protein
VEGAVLGPLAPGMEAPEPVGGRGPASLAPAGAAADGSPAPDQASFADVLAAAGGGLQLSTHAQRRLEQRGLELDELRARRLRRALDQLAARGGRSSLVWLDAVAYLVDVRGQRVVTAVPTAQGKEVLFTQIDSVVFA